uniref:HDC10421 n=1 Tax=Drosophila melanogaster TaxID=7227 RepID=Q6IL44_DROME|nr:TPA_inf: HDC10421 [Drosophila melanogaster]
MWLVGCWLMAIYRRCTICASGWLAILRAAVHPDAHFHCELRRGSSSGSWFINWDRVLIRFVREVRHSPASTFRNKKWEGSGASELCNNILMANGGGGLIPITPAAVTQHPVESLLSEETSRRGEVCDEIRTNGHGYINLAID